MKKNTTSEESAEMDSAVKEEILPRIDRRTFIKAGAALGATVAAGRIFTRTGPAKAEPWGENLPDILETDATARTVFSVCQNCHSRCTIMCKVVAGTLEKIDGNPYSPLNMLAGERLTYATPASDAALVRGRVCPKGQAGVQVLYDPQRIKHPLRRVGARGSGKWEAISWTTAFTEIAARIAELIPTSTRMTALVDPSIPSLGPAANGLMFAPGRSTDAEIIERIFKNTYGTANYRLDHTSICEQSHHVVNEAITEDKAIWGGSITGKNHFKPDFENCEHVLLFGQNPVEANFPMVELGMKIADFKKRGGTITLVDPRFNNTAAKANRWVPITPGTDGALALGIGRWIVDNAAYDSTYLANANAAAATADLEKTFTDACRLVMLRSDTGSTPGRPGSFLQAQYLDATTYGGTFGTGGNTNKVTSQAGTPVEIGASALHGDLDIAAMTLTPSAGAPAAYVWADGMLHCKSVFGLYKERVQERTISEYASICGLDSATIVALASEFTSHGKMAVANTYRGVVQHTNGASSHLAVMALNHLIGNYSWAGGNSTGGGGWKFNSVITDGSVPTDVKVTGIPSPVTPSGPRIDRTKGADWESFKSNVKLRRNASSEYPAKRPWFKFGTHGNFQEVIPSIADQYPYPCKVLIAYWNAWPYSTPALRNVFEATARDETKIPLFVAISKDMGEVAAFADYILPDTSYLEKWSFPGSTPTTQTKLTGVRQPVVGTFDSRAWGTAFDIAATNEYHPILPDTRTFEDILIGLMNALGLNPGVTNAWQFAKWELYHLAQDYKTTSGSTASLDQIVTDILAKGGVFADPGSYVDADGRLSSGYSGVIHLYLEPIGNWVDSITGTLEHDPLPAYVQIKDVAGNVVSDPAYPYKLITYKRVLHGQARTHQLPWLMAIEPENFAELNSADALGLGIASGDRIRISSSSNPSGIVGKAKVVEGLRPGVVAVSHSYGHWQNGANPWFEDGVQRSADSTRGAGMSPNMVMSLDPVLRNVSLQDKIGASCSFYDTWVKVERA